MIGCETFLNDIPWQAKVVIAIVYISAEAWLGKTDKTKSGSVPELVFNLLKAALKGKRNG